MVYYMLGKRMYRYPSSRTIFRLKDRGFSQLVWQNGDFVVI